MKNTQLSRRQRSNALLKKIISAFLAVVAFLAALVTILSWIGIGPFSHASTSSSTPLPTTFTNAQQSTTTTTTLFASPTPTPTPIRPGSVLYTADWSNGLDGWFGSSQWKVVNNGVLGSDGSATNSFTIWAGAQLATPNYAVEAHIQFVRSPAYHGTYEFGIMLRGDGAKSGYLAGVGVGAPAPWTCDPTILISKIFVANVQNGDLHMSYDGCVGLPNLVNKDYVGDTNTHTYRLEARGNDLTFLIDGYKILETTDNTYIAAGQVGLLDAYGEINVSGFKVIAL